MDKEKYILLTVDVEDWFQVENFKPWIPFETWDQCEPRVEKNTHQLLNLFDSIELKAHSSKLKTDQAYSSKLTAKNQKETDYELSAMSYELKSNGQRTSNDGRTKKVRATFFVLGWIAERLPHLVREIQSRGHEIASHGYNHNLANQQSNSDLKQELTDSKKLLEDITGFQVFGFRASNFSINDDTLKIIEGCGYLYDSSYNSFSLHGRYGQIYLNGASKNGIAYKISENFFELPISNLNISYELSAMSLKRNDRNRIVLPWGGGAYFRLIPYWFFRHGVQLILKKERAYLFYLHPWEIDPNQPRVRKASLNYRFRHYQNLKKTKTKLTNLLEGFYSCRFITCSEYLRQAGRQEG